MALLYIDNFEMGAVGVDLDKAPNASFFGVSGLLGSRDRFIRVLSGTLSEKMVVARSWLGGAVGFYFPTLLFSSEKITVGLAVSCSNEINNNPSGADLNGSRPISFSGSANSSVLVKSDGSFVLGNFTSPAGLFLDSVFCYIEVSVDYSNGNFDVWVNNQFQGSGVMTFSGDKRINFSDPVNGGRHGYIFFDDIYILDDTGTTHNQRLGPVRAVRVPFNSTTETNFTPFGAIDNITAINKDSPNTSTYNRSPAANNVGDYFKLDTSVLPSDRPIIAVQQSAMYRKTDIGERTLKLVAKEGVDRKELLLPERLATFSGGPAQILETAADGSAWDLTNLAATDFGYEAS